MWLVAHYKTGCLQSRFFYSFFSRRRHWNYSETITETVSNFYLSEKIITFDGKGRVTVSNNYDCHWVWLPLTIALRLFPQAHAHPHALTLQHTPTRTHPTTHTHSHTPFNTHPLAHTLPHTLLTHTYAHSHLSFWTTHRYALKRAQFHKHISTLDKPIIYRAIFTNDWFNNGLKKICVLSRVNFWYVNVGSFGSKATASWSNPGIDIAQYEAWALLPLVPSTRSGV